MQPLAEQMFATTITKKDVEEFPLEDVVRPRLSNFQITPSEFFGPPGREMYRFLATLSSKFHYANIIDIKTHAGSTALALGVNETNSILSFDTQRVVPLRDQENISFELADLMDPDVREFWAERILASDLLILDMHPHTGNEEFEFVEWLRAHKYRGLIVVDDIWYFKGMRDNFWFKIPTAEKLDVTNLSHWSGLGLISFEPRPEIVFETALGPRWIGQPEVPRLAGPNALPQSPEVAQPEEPSPWTVVTAYFDLTRMPDASPAICARDRKHYFTNAVATMNLDANLVVYCEEDSLEDLKAMRPAHLASRTRYEVVDFETLPLTQYRGQIQQNRKDHPYRGDERNTASYYLFCMSRYSLLKRTMDENPFHSTHFAWLNLCIERMGYQNVAHLEEIFKGPPEDLVKVCYIDYIARDLVADTNRYFEFGRCSLCSGFFTGGRTAFYEFCTRIEEKFLEYLRAGVGHADEQLFSPVYFEAPELFKPYFGDYQQMCTNYRYCYDNPDITTRLLIPKAAAAADWRTVYAACEFLWESVRAGTVTLTDQQKKLVLTNYATAAFELGRPGPIKENGALDTYYLGTL